MGSRPGRGRQRGQIIVLFEIMLIVILGFLRNNRQTLVNAVDAGALAGGTMLPVTGPDEANATNLLIAETIQADYPGLTAADFTITYKCLIGADDTGPLLTRDIPGVCDPRPSLLHNPGGNILSLEPYFRGAGLTRFSDCDPSAGDKCNVVYVTASKLTQFSIGPIIGVDQGTTGSISSAACKGACGAAPVVPVDVVIILDRTLSMAGNDSTGANKIQALQTAAKTVLSVYDPAEQRIALSLTGPAQINGSGDPTLANCSGYGSVYGKADDTNFSQRTHLVSTGSTNLVGDTTFLSTTLAANISSTGTTSISVSDPSKFPASGDFTIQIDSEQMLVTAGQGTSTWKVTRGYNSTTRKTHSKNAVVGWALSNAQSDNVIKVNSDAGFPSSGNFTIQVDNEQMTVTNVATDASGTVTWTVTRPGSGRATHGGQEDAYLVYGSGSTTIRVDSASGFPTSGKFTVKIDNEDLVVTGGQGTTTWTVQRGQDSTSAATHLGGAGVIRIVGRADTQIQVDDPLGLPFPDTPFQIAVGGTSNDEWMQVDSVSGSSAPYTWNVSNRGGGNGFSTHATGTIGNYSSGDTVYERDPWVASSSTVGMWVPVGLSGTDSMSPPPAVSGAAGDYHDTNSPLYKAISCISAATAGTDLATAIRMAQWYLDHYGRPGVTQGIILETDGHPQYGFSGSGDETTTNADFTCTNALAAANAAKADTTKSPDGIQMFTIGYGVDSSVRCPIRGTGNNGTYNPDESTTWSNKQATSLLLQMATDADHYFENPPSSELASVFTQAATILVQGGSHLIQLYPRPIVDGAGGDATMVSVVGQYFTGASLVYFGNAAGTIMSVSDSSISVVPPALPSGTVVPVTVTTPAGTSFITSSSYYTFP
jgi:hypothetical protein